MRKISFLLTFLLTLPTFANITNESSCDNNTLNSYAKPVDMEAKWTANTINLQWYDDANDSTPTNTMCTYNTTIALPAEPTKPGYNFTGWQLRINYCDFSGLVDTNGNNHQGHSNTGICYNNGLNTVNCNTMPDVALNEWKVSFDHGTVRGIARCTNKAGDRHDKTWPEDFVSDWKATDAEMAQASSSGAYCWCKITEYTPILNNTCAIASPSWIFNLDYGVANCARLCAHNCAAYVHNNYDFRRAMYGITE